MGSDFQCEALVKTCIRNIIQYIIQWHHRSKPQHEISFQAKTLSRQFGLNKDEVVILGSVFDCLPDRKPPPPHTHLVVSSDTNKSINLTITQLQAPLCKVSVIHKLCYGWTPIKRGFYREKNPNDVSPSLCPHISTSSPEKKIRYPWQKKLHAHYFYS